MKKKAGSHNRGNTGKAKVKKSGTRVAEGKQAKTKRKRSSAEKSKNETLVQPIANGLMAKDLELSAQEQQDQFLVVGRPSHSRKAS